MLGVAAATALPSEVWPFRKIFLPPAPQVLIYDWCGYTWETLAFTPYQSLLYNRLKKRALTFDFTGCERTKELNDALLP